MTLGVNVNHLLEYDEILYNLYLKDDEYSGDIFFQISYATLIIRLLIMVISDLKVNFNYLWDLNEMFYKISIWMKELTQHEVVIN